MLLAAVLFASLKESKNFIRRHLCYFGNARDQFVQIIALGFEPVFFDQTGNENIPDSQ